MGLMRRTELGSALQVGAARISDDLASRQSDRAGRKGPSETVFPIEMLGFETRVSQYIRETDSLFWFDVTGGTINRHDAHGRSIMAPLGRPVSVLCVGDGGELWVVSKGRLFQLDPVDGAVVGEPISHPLLADVVSAQAFDDGFVLVTGTSLWCFSSKGEALQRFEKTGGLEGSRFYRHGMAAVGPALMRQPLNLIAWRRA